MNRSLLLSIIVVAASIVACSSDDSTSSGSSGTSGTTGGSSGTTAGASVTCGDTSIDSQPHTCDPKAQYCRIQPVWDNNGQITSWRDYHCTTLPSGCDPSSADVCSCIKAAGASSCDGAVNTKCSVSNGVVRFGCE